jgi:hypothetical protein
MPPFRRTACAVVLDTKGGEHLDTPVVHPNREVCVDATAGLSEQREVPVGQQLYLRETVEFDRTELTDGLCAALAEILVHTPG